jgi:hypothetical protein
MALFDRISDEEFSKGNFHFFAPSDPAIFRPYGEVEFDEVIRQWRTGDDVPPPAAQPADSPSGTDAAEPPAGKTK